MQAIASADAESIRRVVGSVCRQQGQEGLSAILADYVARVVTRKFDPSRGAKVTTFAHNIASRSLQEGSEFMRIHGPERTRGHRESDAG